ncbi:MAG: HAMP domain-containing protein [Proteobacteria bacterium]|nr:HAMP domain-containing protein [Pseudomonadota bacterium]
MKLFFIFTLIIIILFLITGILFFNQWKNFSIKSTVSNLKNFSEVNSTKIIDTYLQNVTNRTFFINREIYYIKEKQPLLKDILVVKTNGTTIYEFSHLKTNYKREINDFIVKNAITFETSIDIIDNYLVVIVPYVDKWDRHYYSNVFMYDLSGIHSSINKYLIYFIIFEVLIIFIASIIGYLLSSISTNRLEKVVSAAKRMEMGDFETLIVLKGNDEFSQIARILEKSRKSIKQYVEKLNLTIEKLRENNILKDQFLENISHELKTPLTSIIGYIDYLKNEKLGQLNERQKEAIVKISNNTLKLNELISSLLLIQDKYKNKIEKIELYYILKEVCSSYRDIIDKKGLALECEFNEYNYILLSERDKLFAIFQNVIGNAIKFTDKGYIKISVTELERKRVRITVEDTGVGIPKDKTDKMFKRFVQLDGTKTRRFGGVGIGLYTVKEFLDDMSGDIKIESEINEGTEVIIEIPYIKRTKKEKFNLSI